MQAMAIVAALAEEADALLPGQGARGALGPFPLRRIDDHARPLAIITCGVGKVHAAMASAMLVQHLGGTGAVAALVMTGTCGRLTDRAGDAFWLAEAVQHDYGAAHPGGFTPYRGGDWPIGPAGPLAFAAMADPGLGLPHARIISGDAFVACPDRAGELARALGADLLDMEVAAMAQAAHRMGLPWAAVKAPTDTVDGNSADDFAANLAAAAARAARGVEALLTRADAVVMI